MFLFQARIISTILRKPMLSKTMMMRMMKRRKRMAKRSKMNKRKRNRPSRPEPRPGNGGLGRSRDK